MKSYSEKQAQIDFRRLQTIKGYPELWARTLAEWHSSGPDDRAWLMYSANYLLRTGKVRWALDPVRFPHYLPEAPNIDMAQDLRDLSFVLLTHRHDDHLDLGLIRALRTLSIVWIVPQDILSVVTEIVSPRGKIIVPKMMVPIEIEGIKIWPFEGMHWEVATNKVEGSQPEDLRGVPATSYLVEFSGKRWLFPGDVRTYDARTLPVFGKIDGLFAHLWLGRGSALIDPPPLLESFCRFCLETRARRVVLTHLEEFGRMADNYWDTNHLLQVLFRFREIAPWLPVTPLFMGESIDL
ncbi:MAG: MBL fold metallo-hydrolase [Anaerolineales bacterium]|jgi:hypothetical protein